MGASLSYIVRPCKKGKKEENERKKEGREEKESLNNKITLTLRI
jgi:hypothetical protein